MLFCIVETLTQDDSVLLLLRFTCKRPEADVPLAYDHLHRMKMLLDKVESWLHEMVISLAPSLIFETKFLRGRNDKAFLLRLDVKRTMSSGVHIDIRALSTISIRQLKPQRSASH